MFVKLKKMEYNQIKLIIRRHIKLMKLTRQLFLIEYLYRNGKSNYRKFSASIRDLTTTALPLPDTGFYHFGINNDLIQSLYDIQNLVSDQSLLGTVATLAQPRQYILNADFKAARDMKSNQ